MEARIFKLVFSPSKITNVLASISVNSLTYNKVLFRIRTHYKQCFQFNDLRWWLYIFVKFPHCSHKKQEVIEVTRLGESNRRIGQETPSQVLPSRRMTAQLYPTHCANNNDFFHKKNGDILSQFQSCQIFFQHDLRVKITNDCIPFPW